MFYPNFYHFQEENEIPSPQLIYYPEIIRKNTEKAIRDTDGADHLWPHVKTHKMAEMIHMQMDYGITKFKCATISEAEMVASCGANAIIVAYPLVGPNIARFLALQKAFPETHFYAIADDLSQLQLLGNAAFSRGKIVDVLADVDTGFHRTGVYFDALVDFYHQASSIAGVHMSGFHVYDGQNHQSDAAVRQAAVDTIEEKFYSLYQKLTLAGFDTSITVFGGTPSMPCFAGKLSRYRHAYLSPGTLFVGDYGYGEGLPDMSYAPGAAILTRVVSLPQPNTFTLDLGTKGISTDQKTPGLLLDVPAKPLFQSEEHWVYQMLEGHESERPLIGDVLYVLPSHICPTTALYPSVPIVEDGHMVGSWEVSARVRKLTI